ncbi:MAG: NAD-dependent epimerase/dehydratase family protein [Pseudomonadota bacterium]
MSRSVLVTGADGFVGRHLVAKLSTRGDAVRALDRSFRGRPQTGTEYIEADVLNGDMMRVALEGVEIIYHLAANTGLWAPDDSVYQTVNVEGTRRVLTAAADSGVQRFVYCSSFVTVISGPSGVARTVTQEDSAEPAALFGAYARSKKRAERLILETDLPIETVAVLPSAPLGPGDNNLTAPTKLLLDLVNGAIPATLDQIINFVDVRALADGIIAASDRGHDRERYLLVGENLKMRTFLDKVGALSGRKMPTTKVPYRLASAFALLDDKLFTRFTKRPPKAPLAGVRMAGRKLSFDGSKARDDLGFEAPPIDDAIKDALAWLKDEGLYE